MADVDFNDRRSLEVPLTERIFAGRFRLTRAESFWPVTSIPTVPLMARLLWLRFHCRDNEPSTISLNATPIANILFQLRKLLF